VAEAPIMDLARAALSPEEMGEAEPFGPTPEPEHQGVARFLKLDLDETETHAEGCLDLNCEGCSEPKPEEPNIDGFTRADMSDPQIMRFRNLDLD